MTTTNLNDLAFNTKSEYLSWVKEWKAYYKQLSRDIREAKIAFRAAQRANDYSLMPRNNPWVLSSNANTAMQSRMAAKIKSNNQFLAARSKDSS